MNTPRSSERKYQAVITHQGSFIASQIIRARNRRKAVTHALNWFWYTYKGKLGPADQAIVIDDPYNEVQYGPQFRCNDRMNKLLPVEVCERVILQSQGNLTFDTRSGCKYHRPNSVRRVRRRRDFGRFIAPCLRQLNSGALYYRIITRPQITQNGVMISKRGYRDVRLKSRNLEDALFEIQNRGLHLFNREQTARKMKARELPVIAHVLGLVHLGDKKLRRVRHIIEKYNRHRPCKTCVI